MTNSKRAFILLVTFILFLCGCSTNSTVNKRYFLNENSIEVVEKPTGSVANISYNNSISRPEIVGLVNTKIQDSINKELDDYISSVILNFESELSKSGYVNKSANVTFNSSGRVDNSLILGYSTYANYNNVLCLSIDYYSSINGKWESGIKVFRYDLNTGRHLELKDLFPEGMDYKTKMTQAINMEILNEGLEEYLLNSPLNGIDTCEDFYFNENTITVVFNSKNNPIFTDTSSFNFIDSPMNIHSYIYDNLISFPVSFAKLDNGVTIFDKYLSDKNIYKTPKNKKRLIPDYIHISSPVSEKKVGNTTFKAFYFQIYDMENKSLKDKINRIALKEVDDFLNEKRLKEADEKLNIITLDSSELKNCETFLRLTLISNGNYLSIIKTVDFEKMLHYDINAICRCFDIRTGKEIGINDLFKKGYDYVSVIDKSIKKTMHEYGSNPGNFKGLKESGKFTFFIISHPGIDFLVINLVNSVEELNRGYYIPFPDFQQDKLKIYE